MNSRMTKNSQLLTTEPKKKNKPQNKLSKQLEQEQNHTNGDHVEGYQQGGESGGGEGTGKKKHKWWVQNRQGWLRIVWEMEKPKNLYVQPMDMN